MTVETAGVAIAEVVRTVVEALVDEPQQVSVLLGKKDNLVLLDVQVAEGDHGRVIGKSGMTVRSLRTIVGALCGKFKVRCELNIVRDQTTSLEEGKNE